MAKRRRISPKLLADLHADVQAGDPGTRTATVQAAAKSWGIHPSTIYRQWEKLGLGTDIDRRRDAERPEYRVWVRIIMMLALKSPDGQPIPLEIARDSGLRAGLLPPECADAPLNTLHRIAREMGYRETRKRVNRLWSEHAHQIVLFDASHSQYFSVVKRLDDGDYLLRLDKRPRVQREYKNKPVNKDRLRVLYYSTWDMHSGAIWQRATVAKGESGPDAIDFLCAFMLPHADPRDPVRGKMQDLWVDNGPLSKNKSVLDLLDRLSINVKPGVPYAKERQGGVEQTWRRLWQSFERAFFLPVVPGAEPGTLAAGEITLSQLNALLQDHLYRINQKKARYQPTISKWQAWSRSAAAQGGLPALPPHALETIVTQHRAYVGQNGCFQWDNVVYEVEKLYCRWVYAYRSLSDASAVTVEDIETGEKFAAWVAKPNLPGEYEGHAYTPVQEARRDGAALAGALPLDGVNAPNVVAFRRPEKPAEPLYDHLDAGRYATRGEALRAFGQIHGMPSFGLDHPDQFDQAVDIIMESGLSKAVVRELALALQRAARAAGE